MSILFTVVSWENLFRRQEFSISSLHHELSKFRQAVIFIEACVVKAKVKELKKSLHSAQVNTLIQVPFIKRKEYVNFLTNERLVKASLSLAFPLSKEGASKIKTITGARLSLCYSDTRIFEAAKTLKQSQAYHVPC